MPLPTGTHNDWIWPFSSIQRAATARVGPAPTDVSYSANFDHANHHPDVPNNGAWALSRSAEYGLRKGGPGWSFAIVHGNVLYAFGTFRFDYSLGYYTYPRFTIKKLK
jgi:hypothetical protein